MPTRLLREGILDSDAVNSLSLGAEVFYRRLMSVVDDFGRFDARPSVLRSRLFPLRTETVKDADISAWLKECEVANLIAVYSHNSKPFLLFGKVDAPRAKVSKYPQPPADVYNRLQPQTPVNICAQPLASVTYSYSGSDSNSNSNSHTNAEQTPAGVKADAEKPAVEKPQLWANGDHPLFPKFWKAYPNHANRTTAARAFAELNPTDELLAELLAAIDAQKKWDQWQRKIIPHAANWLNDRRWLDEPPEAPGPAKSAGTWPDGKTTLEKMEDAVKLRQQQAAESAERIRNASGDKR